MYQWQSRESRHNPTSVCLRAKSLQSCLTLCNPMDCSPPGSSAHGFSRQEYWSGLPCPLPGHLPDPGMERTSPALQVEFFTTEPPGKVKVKLLSRVRIFARLLHPWDSPGKNTGVGCHFLLQAIFPTQGSNPGLPHCRQTL